jgi:phage terminase large subunit-like protein
MRDDAVGMLMRGLAFVQADGSRSHLAPLLDRDPWQRTDYDAIIPALLPLVGIPAGPASRRHWIERPRGHSKTTDTAALATWLLMLTGLVASPRPLRMVAAAADAEQAGLLLDAIRRLIQANASALDWKTKDTEGRRGLLDVQESRVICKSSGAELAVISSDVASSWGLLPDVVICDELTVWPTKAERLWESLFSAAAKKPGSVLIVIGNAGWKDSWQWHLRERVREDPAWRFSRLEGPQASWISEETLAEQRRILPPTVYDRVWLNRWSAGAGDALNEQLIQAALKHAGPMAWERGWVFHAGLDIGLTRDASALVVAARHVGFTERKAGPKKHLPDTIRAMIDLGLLEASAEPEEDVVIHPPTGKVRVASVKVWHPTPGRPVSLEEVEDAIVDVHRRYGLSAIGYDPWQAAYLGERLVKKGIGAVPVDPVPLNLKQQATYTLEAFSERQIELYPDVDLLRDLRALRVVERQYGVRLESPRGPAGHGDTASALALAVLIGKRFDLAQPRRVEGELVCWPALSG